MFSDALEISSEVGDLGHRKVWMVIRAMPRVCGAPIYVNSVSHPKSVFPFWRPDLMQKKRKRKRRKKNPTLSPGVIHSLDRSLLESGPDKLKDNPISLWTYCQDGITSRHQFQHLGGTRTQETLEKGAPKQGGSWWQAPFVPGSKVIEGKIEEGSMGWSRRKGERQKCGEEGT